MKVADKATGAVSDKPVTLSKDEGQPRRHDPRRPRGAEAGVRGRAARQGGPFITAGNASQLSDGASGLRADGGEAGRARGLQPLGIYRGIAVAGCDPDEMGIGPVFAVPKLLKAHGLKIDDIDLWELNEAFAVPGDLLPRPARHPTRQAQRRRRRDLDRPSLRHDRRAHGRPRADRGQAARRAAMSS